MTNHELSQISQPLSLDISESELAEINQELEQMELFIMERA